jgi:hypothetical protein
MYNSTLKITDNFPRGLKLNLKFYAKVIIVDDESSGRKLIKEYLEYYPIILLWAKPIIASMP